MPKRDDIKSVLVIGSGPDRHRPGLRVRLLRHAGLPGAARGGHPRHPRQQQPGDDHDRPGVRRRHLRRADHPRGRRGDHRQGAARRGARDPRGPDRTQLRDRPARERSPREVRLPAHRRQRRGDPARRGPREVQGRRRALRRRVGALDHLPHDGRVPRRRQRSSAYPVVVRPSFTMGGLGSGFAYDEADLRRIGGAGPAVLPDDGGAPRGVDPRLEGVRARGHARPRRQRRRRLLHREPRPDGRAHRATRSPSRRR